MSVENLDYEIINGLLLSDATLMKLKNENRNSRMYLSLHIKNYDTVLYFAQMLERAKIRYSWGRNGNQIWLSTLTDKIFTKLRKRWYVNGIKIVPFDLILTPKTIAFWYMGDGNSYWVSGNHDKKVNITFSVEGFDTESINHLKTKLQSFLQTKINIHRSKKKYQIIRISKSFDVDLFFRMIQNYVLPSFSYKIKFPLVRTHEEQFIECQKKAWRNNKDVSG